MKHATLSILFAVLSALLLAQAAKEPPNVFIITLDGFRWQEIFNGADTGLMANPRFVQDTGLLKILYGGSSAADRRKKLLPFFWEVVAGRGQLYGNRAYGNKADVRNFYKISYAGYNEIFTGYADPRLVPNTPRNNPNINLPAFLNTLDAYKGKVAAFSSWNIFPYILNEAENHFPVNSGYEAISSADPGLAIIDRVQDSLRAKTACRHDRLTFLMAKEYIQMQHPRVGVLSLGETDEDAHSGRYDLYLQHANDADRMLAELWYFVQTDPFYKDNTVFVITTDHGRGRKNNTWTNHHLFVRGSGEIWLALLGQGISAAGEITGAGQVYQNQIAQTIAHLLGEKFVSNHPTGKPILLPFFTDANKEAAKPLAIRGE